MKRHLFAVAVLLFAPELLAQDDALRGPRQTKPAIPAVLHRQYRLPAAEQTAEHGRVAPLFETVGNPRLVKYKLQSDVPDYTQNYDGHGVTVAANESIPRNYYGIGMEGGRMQGGGCFPVDPSTTICLQEPDANGNLVTIQKARERWTFRISYLDPSDPNASEFNVGFDTTGFGGGGDSIWEWERRTPGGHSCFTFYEDVCDTYHLNLNTIEGTAQWFTPQCFLKLGPGYRGYLFYQYSRYNFGDTIPPGAQEWVPNTPATTTRLEVPGKVLFSRDWLLGRSENALAITGPGFVHPAVNSDTGYPTAAPTIAQQTATVTVSSEDCGVIPNVAFTITREFVEASGGHAHPGPPPLDNVSALDAYTGTTDRNGRWSTTLLSGEIGSTLKYTASTPDLGGTGAFTSQPLLVTTGFVGLTDPGPNDSNIRYSGNATTAGLRHPSNHNASPELHAFARTVAAVYNARVAPEHQGSFGLNDMSIPVGGVFDFQGTWAPPHFRHRFGTDCDIDRRLLLFSDGVTFEFIKRRTLRDVVENELDGILLVEAANRLHIQVPEYQVGTILLRETR